MKKFKIVYWEEYVNDYGCPSARIVERIVSEDKLKWLQEYANTHDDLRIYDVKEVK